MEVIRYPSRVSQLSLLPKSTTVWKYYVLTWRKKEMTCEDINICYSLMNTHKAAIYQVRLFIYQGQYFVLWLSMVLREKSLPSCIACPFYLEMPEIEPTAFCMQSRCRDHWATVPPMMEKLSSRSSASDHGQLERSPLERKIMADSTSIGTVHKIGY